MRKGDEEKERWIRERERERRVSGNAASERRWRKWKEIRNGGGKR